MARQSEYDPAICAGVLALCQGGATDAELADELDISIRTLYRWQARYPEFCQALKAGKQPADDRVERSLFHRANGYEWDEAQPIKLKEVLYEAGKRVKETERVEVVMVHHVAPPDTTAAIFWLKNRRPERWRQFAALEHTGKDGAPFVIHIDAVDGKL